MYKGVSFFFLVLSINVHPSPWRGGSVELIPQESGKVNKVGVANIFTGHPSHGDLITITKNESSKELLHQSDVLVLLNLNEGMEPKLLCDPNGLNKVRTVPLKVIKVKYCPRANLPLLERGIKFLHDELLLPLIKVAISRFLREHIEDALPHLHKLWCS
jgi:hypothetical protein